MATLAFVVRTVSVTALEPDPIEVFDLFPPSTGVTYVNRIWQLNDMEFVRWETVGAADPTGASYPGAGTFGIDTSDYCVEGTR